MEKHSGAIKTLEFNHHQSHLLATAGAKGEIFVWDLNKIQSPYSPGTQSSRHDEIEAVAWNRNIAHILATGGNTGFTSVWDLKNKREVLHLHYSGASGRKAVSSVVWHPSNSTKVLTASVDDASPVILLWDLRNANAPERILEGHEKGILSLDWCKHDSGLLLSSGKDNRTLLWNPETGEKLAEYPIATNWSFETSFNPSAPDIFASASFDGKITVQTLQDVSVHGKENEKKPDGDDFWNPSSYVDSQHPISTLKQAPKWLRNPVSATFGFGGKIVSVYNVDGQSTVSLTKFVGDESITEETSKFAKELQSEDISNVARDKSTAAKKTTDKYDWEVLSALLGSGNKKEKLSKFYTSTRLDENGSISKVKAANSEKSENGKSDENDLFSSTEGGEDFLSELSVSEKFVPQGSFDIFSKDQKNVEVALTGAVLKGNFEAAVDLCLKEGNMADAFMLALNGSEKAKAKVQNAYLSKNASSKPYIRLLASFNGEGFNDLVENANVNEWKEIITGLFTFCEDEREFREYCGTLGDRLLQARKTTKNKNKSEELRNSAVFCYLAGSNLEKTALVWLGEVPENEREDLKAGLASTPYVAHVKALHSFIEKVAIFRKAGDRGIESDDKLSHLHDAYREYANIVASQGELELAEQYLDLLPSQYPGLSLEKERVTKASNKAAIATTTARKPSAISIGTTKGPASSIYTPVQQKPVVPLAPLVGAPQPQHQQPQARAAVPPYTSPYSQAPVVAPVASTSPYAPVQPVANPYQPQAGQMLQPTPLQRPPPPTAGPLPPKKDVGGWNDLPANAITVSVPRRPPSNSQTISTPFPNQPAVTSPPVTSPNHVYGAATMSPPPQVGPPPPKTVAPPTSTTPVALPPKSGPSTSPSSPQQNPRYAPTLANPSLPQQQVSTPGYSSTYGASSQQQYPARNAVASPPPVNPYAAAAAIPISKLATVGYGPAVPNAPPPMGMGPVQPSGPGVSPYGYGQSPVLGQLPIQAQPPQPISPVQKEVEQPKLAPKHPTGDRSHIPENAKPIYELLDREFNRVKPSIPPNFARHIKDAEKRLNILYDHLNNEELLSDDAIASMISLAQALVAKDFDTAFQIHLDILTSKSNECGQWMVGVKRLIEMARAIN